MLEQARLDTWIKEHNLQRDALGKEIQVYIKDITHTLDDRWAIFEAAHKAKLLPHYSWIQRLPLFEAREMTWYDDFGVEKYRLVEWIDVVNDIVEEHDEGWVDETSGKDELFDLLPQIKEEVLAAGYGSFTFDW